MIWNRIRQWLGSEPGHKEDVEEALMWYEPGPDNPFGVRLLDCRPVAWEMVSTTGDPDIASRFVALRNSDGRDLAEAPIQDPVRVGTSLTFPHDGSVLEGIVSKAGEMEEKWDIYIYDSVFLFARSWTGDLIYRASASVGGDAIRISEVECPAAEAELAASAVYYLIATHAMGRVFPHQIPVSLDSGDPMTIAMWSFSKYGRLGCYATKADITAIPIERPEE